SRSPAAMQRGRTSPVESTTFSANWQLVDEHNTQAVARTTVRPVMGLGGGVKIGRKDLSGKPFPASALHLHVEQIRQLHPQSLLHFFDIHLAPELLRQTGHAFIDDA